MGRGKVGRNSAKAWFLATRPKTLSGATLPVTTACALAYSDGGFQLFPAIVCMAFAVLMQIASNLINDLYDFKKGTDREDRLGPPRATAQGWISPAAMRAGIAVAVTLAGAAGMLLVNQAGLWLVGVGAVCMIFAFLYTTTLSYRGMGDILVLVFFGLVPATATYYLQTGAVSAPAVICAAACGINIDTLLAINNFRDRDTDRRGGKRTLTVIFGARFGKMLYLSLGVASATLTLSLAYYGKTLAALLPLLYLPLHISTWRTMARIDHGRELNRVLGMTSRNMMVFGTLLAAGLCLGEIM